MNVVMLVGRVTKIDTLYDKTTPKIRITMAVQRCFKNEDGIYDIDFVPVIASGTIAEKTKQYAKNGDVISVKGSMQLEEYINEDNDYVSKKLEIVANKVSLLASAGTNIN